MSRESNDGSARRGGKTTHVLSASGSATGTCAANSPPVGVQLAACLQSAENGSEKVRPVDVKGMEKREPNGRAIPCFRFDLRDDATRAFYTISVDKSLSIQPEPTSR
ncbi:hypothetical protein K0M31_003409 [Melipona bicolor]|uniref:Uncharacterized protein n=1 Tax=Melipona bicolor TaxID=60889 RepID=A0AA40KPI9_9HYME|nr:hypothetical protein K0M31_003409 [Melipona bicolor]